MTFEPRAAMRKSIQHLHPYYKAPTEPLLRLDQNTNLEGRNPAIKKVGLEELEFNQYPTRDADRLLQALEAHYELPPGTVLAANGSDEVLDIIVKAFTDPGDVFTTPSPSYSLYPFYAALHGLQYERVVLDEDWDLDVDALLATNPKILLVASPNNPTGRAAPYDSLHKLVRLAPGLVVVDEAYQEYNSEPSLLGDIMDHRNLIVMRTFSKAFALAGARIGWLAAHPDTIEVLSLAKPPFNVNVMSEELGVRALSEMRFVEGGVASVRKERPLLARDLTQLGFQVVPSDANFLLTFPPADGLDGPTLAVRLRELGIAARVFAQTPRLERAIRFTVGRPENNKQLVAALKSLLEASA